MQVLAALELKEEIKASGLKGSSEIYSRLVSICTENGDYQAAQQTAREMEQLGLPLDTICCTALIKVRVLLLFVCLGNSQCSAAAMKERQKRNASFGLPALLSSC